MNKDTLLDQLPKYPTNSVALRLARKGLSDEEINKTVAALTVRKRKLNWASNVNALLTCSLFLWIFALGVYAIDNPDWVGPPSGTAAALGGLFSLVTVVGLTLCVLSRSLVQLPQLVPLKDTDLCEMTLEWVASGGANVMAWRDLALTERNQLYCFDHIVMHLLVEQHKAEQAAAERQAANADACRKLHGVPT